MDAHPLFQGEFLVRLPAGSRPDYHPASLMLRAYNASSVVVLDSPGA